MPRYRGSSLLEYVRYRIEISAVITKWNSDVSSHRASNVWAIETNIILGEVTWIQGLRLKLSHLHSANWSGIKCVSDIDLVKKPLLFLLLSSDTLRIGQSSKSHSGIRAFQRSSNYIWGEASREDNVPDTRTHTIVHALHTHAAYLFSEWQISRTILDAPQLQQWYVRKARYRALRQTLPHDLLSLPSSTTNQGDSTSGIDMFRYNLYCSDWLIRSDLWSLGVSCMCIRWWSIQYVVGLICILAHARTERVLRSWACTMRPVGKQKRKIISQCVFLTFNL